MKPYYRVVLFIRPYKVVTTLEIVDNGSHFGLSVNCRPPIGQNNANTLLKILITENGK